MQFFSAAVEKNCFFAACVENIAFLTAAKKKLRGRPGFEATDF